MTPFTRFPWELVEEISAACREQDIRAVQVNQAIQQLDKVIQQNAGAADEMHATSDALSGQAERLHGAIEFFKIGAGAAVSRSDRLPLSRLRANKSNPWVKSPEFKDETRLGA